MPALRRDWEHLAKKDPMWAVCSDPAKKGRKWDRDDFFAYGRWEVDELMRQVRTLAPTLQRCRALDFGCGLGRLTQALSAHFETAVGVDVSETMVSEARRYAAGIENCSYLVDRSTDLREVADDSVDFLYSRLVLQHVPPEFTVNYIRQFVRVLRHGGVAVFQVPSEELQPTKFEAFAPRLVRDGVARLRGLLNLDYRMRLFGVPEQTIRTTVADAGAGMLEVRPDESAGPTWISKRYAILKLHDASSDRLVQAEP